MRHVVAAILGITFGTALCSAAILLAAKLAGTAQHWVWLQSPGVVVALTTVLNSLVVFFIVIRQAKKTEPEKYERPTPLVRWRERLLNRPEP